MKTKKLIVILPNGTAVALDAKDPITLEELQFMVGGYIETVPTLNLPEMNGRRIIMVVNEEGKLKNLPRNSQATLVAAIRADDYIVGRAVLCKEDGEELRPFDEDETEKLLKKL